MTCHLYAGCVSQREGCICAACARNRSINTRFHGGHLRSGACLRHVERHSVTAAACASFVRIGLYVLRVAFCVLTWSSQLRPHHSHRAAALGHDATTIHKSLPFEQHAYAPALLLPQHRAAGGHPHACCKRTVAACACMRPPPFPSASVRARAISLLTPCTHAQPQPRTRLLSCFPVSYTHLTLPTIYSV